MLWQVILAGDALRETLVLFTTDRVRIREAFWTGNVDAPTWWQKGPADLRILPVPPVGEDMDQETVLHRVRGLPRDRFFTTNELTACGVHTVPFDHEATTLARHLTRTASDAGTVQTLEAHEATGSRRALLRDLAAIARRLSNDELRVLLTIAGRAWVGQSRYGCLRLPHDRRDLADQRHLDLAALRADPVLVDKLDPARLLAMLDRCSEEHALLDVVERRLRARLGAVLQDLLGADDRLLTIDQAAAKLGVTEDWLRRRPRLPFAVKLSNGVVRYSARRLDLFVAAHCSK
jgi:hypothetical protein